MGLCRYLVQKAMFTSKISHFNSRPPLIETLDCGLKCNQRFSGVFIPITTSVWQLSVCCISFISILCQVQGVVLEENNNERAIQKLPTPKKNPVPSPADVEKLLIKWAQGALNQQVILIFVVLSFLLLFFYTIVALLLWCLRWVIILSDMTSAELANKRMESSEGLWKYFFLNM